MKVAMQRATTMTMTSTMTASSSVSVPSGGGGGGIPDFSKDNSDKMYDDACDFGQFMINPSLYLFNALCSLIQTCYSTFLADKSKSKRCKNTINDEAAGANVKMSSSATSTQQQQQQQRIRMQQFVYIVTVFGAWAIVFLKVYPLCTASHHVSNHHKTLGYLVFFLCVTSWRCACSTDPGNVTEHTIVKYDRYPYDNVMYKAVDNICPTLQIRKVARSKYCKYTDKHVPRFDHFCGWLNQPIGEENYRWFLVFIFVHVTMCTYGATVLFTLLHGEVLDRRKEEDLLLAAAGNGFVAEVLWGHAWIVVAMLFMCTMTVLLGGFFAFHMWLVSTGMTTNEYYKWQDIKAWHKEATTSYRHQKQIDQGVSHSCSSFSTSMSEHYPQQRRQNTHFNASTDIAIGGEGCGNHMMMGGVVNDPGPMHGNIYNRGILSNFGEVAFPLSLRNKKRHKDL